MTLFTYLRLIIALGFLSISSFLYAENNDVISSQEGFVGSGQGQEVPTNVEDTYGADSSQRIGHNEPSLAQGYGPQFPKNISDRPFRTSGNFNNHFGYSQSFKECEEETYFPWDEALNFEHGRAWYASWNELYAEMESMKSGADAQTFYNKVHGQTKKFLKCEAILKMSKRGAFEDEEVLNNGGKITKQSMVNPELFCVSSGAETQDYAVCKKLIKVYDASQVVQMGNEKIQQMRMLDQQIESKQELASKQQIDTSDVLGVQKDGVEKMAQMAHERAAIDAATAASLKAILSSLPSKQDLVNDCTQEAGFASIISDHNAFVKLMRNKGLRFQQGADFGSFSGDGEVESLCRSVAQADDRDIRHNLIINSRVRDVINGIVWKEGAEAVANIAKGSILNDRAGQIDNAIKDIKAFEPPPPNWAVPEGDAALVSECLKNPAAKGCSSMGRQYGAYGGNTFSISPSGYATEPGSVEAGEVEGEGAAGDGANPSDRNPIQSIGSVVQGVGKKRGFEGSGPGMAGIKRGAKGANAGGGKAGGKLTAPGVSGGGGGGRSGRKRSAASVAGQSMGKGYKGGGGGSLAYSNGARRSRGNKIVKNPFDKLFQKGKNKKGGVVNFRETSSVGQKGGSLFQMISRRYDKVATEKRLLEYQKIK